VPVSHVLFSLGSEHCSSFTFAYPTRCAAQFLPRALSIAVAYVCPSLVLELADQKA
jgi:hypothetical protein